MKCRILIIAIACLLPGCSDRQLYNSMQGARENECRQLADAQKQDRCFESAREPYEAYERRRREARND